MLHILLLVCVGPHCGNEYGIIISIVCIENSQVYYLLGRRVFVELCTLYNVTL